jgi:hypothetical protein
VCIATGARISEVLGLKWKHVDVEAATIKIEQRVWHQDVGNPKSDGSRRILGIGDLAERFRTKEAIEEATPELWVFFQKRAPEKPLWDSGVRDALHQAAEEEGCDFPGLGPHSFRRANITWRQEVGGSAIEASKIAGHSDLEMTGQYTFVAPERQNELTRRIQNKLAKATSKWNGKAEPAAQAASGAPGGPSHLAQTKPETSILQQWPRHLISASKGSVPNRQGSLAHLLKCYDPNAEERGEGLAEPIEARAEPEASF